MLHFSFLFRILQKNCSSSLVSSLSQGSSPAMKYSSTQPRLSRSSLGYCSKPRCELTGQQRAVPTKLWNILRALAAVRLYAAVSPKSIRQIVCESYLLPKRMLSGLMSRCTYNLAWIYFSLFRAWQAIRLTLYTFIRLIRFMMLPVLGPRQPIRISFSLPVSLGYSYVGFDEMLVFVFSLSNPQELVSYDSIFASQERGASFLNFFRTASWDEEGSNTLYTQPNDPSPIFSTTSSALLLITGACTSDRFRWQQQFLGFFIFDLQQGIFSSHISSTASLPESSPWPGPEQFCPRGSSANLQTMSWRPWISQH